MAHLDYKQKTSHEYNQPMKPTRPLIIKCNRCMSALELEGDVHAWKGKHIACPKCGCVNRVSNTDQLVAALFCCALVAIASGVVLAGISALKSHASQKQHSPVPTATATHAQQQNPALDEREFPASIKASAPREALGYHEDFSAASADEKRPLQAQPAASAKPPQTAPSAPAETRGFASKEESLAWDAFEHYKRSLSKGDYTQATNLLAEMGSHLPNANARQAFWDEVVKRVGIIKKLRLFHLCSGCDGGGLCPACDGVGTCSKCRGDKLCVKCKGVDSRISKRCESCSGMICQPCGGSGVCKSCTGYKTVGCQKCRGAGNFQDVSKTDCPSCGGRGYMNGLRRGNGSSAPMRCAKCGGSGVAEKGALRACVDCAGKGRTACGSCDGSGRCAACKGDGRRKTKCAVCDGTGVVTRVCPSCAGLGKCDGCGGNGYCPICAGKKECPSCRADGVTRYMDLPVASSWLSLSDGCWYDLCNGSKPERITGNSSGKLRIHGKKLNGIPSLGTNDVAVIFAAGPQKPLGFLK